jgi:hypothetical protein
MIISIPIESFRKSSLKISQYNKSADRNALIVSKAKRQKQQVQKSTFLMSILE